MAEYNEEKWFNTNTSASYPGALDISFEKLAWFRKKLNWGHRHLGVGKAPAERWATHLQKGLAEPAIVVAVRPRLIVSAYTEEFDCVAMLHFKNGVPEPLDLQPGARLLTVNTFTKPPTPEPRTQIEPDLIPVPGVRSVWFGFHPVIADFVTEDPDAVAQRKQHFSDDLWRVVEERTSAYRQRFPQRLRDGNPYLSHMPAR